MKVLVTDGDNRAALAVTRSLGRAGHHVIVGEKRARSLAQSSRFCADSFAYPDPVVASEAFVHCLATEARARGAEAVFPIADITTFLLTEHRHQFEPACAVPFAPAATVRRAADKVGVLETARRLGIAVPRTVIVSAPSALPELDLPFPVVIKPHQSRIRTAAGWVSTSVSYAIDGARLVADLVSRPAHEFPVMLQERIIGPGMGIFVCYHDGRPIAFFSHRRVRERPPWGGVGVLTESTAMCPVARAHATALLDALGWQGLAMVEFKRDLRDGQPKLMEINGRFWGSLQLAIDAGVDFPRVLLDASRGIIPSEPLVYPAGVRSRWFWGDVDSLLVSLFGGEGAPSLPRASRIAVLGQFLKFWGRDLHYENPRLRDIRPWLYESARWFRTIAAGFQKSTPAAVPGNPNPHGAAVAGRTR